MRQHRRLQSMHSHALLAQPLRMERVVTSLWLKNRNLSHYGRAGGGACGRASPMERDGNSPSNKPTDSPSFEALQVSLPTRSQSKNRPLVSSLGAFVLTTGRRGKLWTLQIDAIVNSTNESMTDRTGSIPLSTTQPIGVAGHIHEAAGNQMAEECDAIGGCRTGDAISTRGYNLPAT